jgi:hypothetical protein
MASLKLRDGPFFSRTTSYSTEGIITRKFSTKNGVAHLFFHPKILSALVGIGKLM